MRKIQRVLAAAFLVLFVTGSACSTRRRATSSPKLQGDLDELAERMDILPPFPTPVPASGSLWMDGGLGTKLVRDTRAFQLNDLVRVRLEESSLGVNKSNTDLKRDSTATYGAPIAFGLERTSAIPGKFGLNEVLRTNSSSDFSGDGTTSRGNQLRGFITSRVLRVLPNGDLIVAGQKTVMVNRERQILTLVGSIRPVDIGPDNEVSSAAVGDLTVRLWGRGEIDSTVRQGWFTRIMQRIWPF